jgi:hyperosmotically inducible protein
MTKIVNISLRLAAITGLLLSSLVFSQDKPTQPDNTKVNKQERHKSADHAKDNASDRELMQKIRKSVVSDKSLSRSAHNVKIIAENGKVTLKGPVRSEEEKKSIEAKANEIAGSGNVTNELTVKESSKKKPA